MRIGVDYYPEHWDEGRWALDARLMREAGISVVRLAEFAWCRMEPHEGQYDFSWLDRALSVLHAEGIQIVLGTPTAAPPAWLHERYPDLYPMDARRYPLGFGTRMQRCLNNDIMRGYAGQITEAMAKQYAGHPAVIGWQIDNELEANLCYCPVCAEKFRAWLQGKYGSLAALNRAWGTVFWSQEYSSWSQIPLPWEARCGRSHNPSLLLDHRRFASESAIGFLREQAEIIRRTAPGQFVTHNLMGLHDSLDYHQLAADLDLVSWNNYPLGFWARETSQPAMAHDVMRGLKQRGFWIMEAQTGVTGWEAMGRRPAPGQVRAWAWQAVAHGAEAVVFFRWRSCLYGTEQFWQGILGHDGVPRRRYQEIARLGREIRELSATLDGTEVRNRAAILHSYEQDWALQIQPQAQGLGWWDQVRTYYGALARLGVNADIVPISVDLARYRLLIVPSWYLLTQADAERLAGFVNAGGTLVLNPRTGVKDERNICHPLPLPTLLRELAGVEVDDYDPLGPDENTVRMKSGGEFTVSAWAEALTLQGAEGIAAYSRSHFAGETAAARKVSGRGAVYYLGVYGEAAFYDALFRRISAEVGLAGLPGLPEGVDACWRRNDESTFLFLINQTDQARTVTLPKGLAAILGDEPAGGMVTLGPFAVGIYGGLVDKTPSGG